MLTIKQLVELVQPGDLFTNINLKTYFPIKGTANKYNKLPSIWCNGSHSLVDTASINWKKSSPLVKHPPGSCLTWGASRTQTVASQHSVQWLQQGPTVMSATSLWGLTAAAHPMMSLGLLHIQSLQRWFASLLLVMRRHKQCLAVVLSPLQYGMMSLC